MITIKNEREIEAMRAAGRITAAARALAGELVKPGVSTKAIDRAVHDFIVSQGAKPSFLNLYGFPASACISVNEVVIHGIPGGYILMWARSTRDFMEIVRPPLPAVPSAPRHSG